MPRWNVSFMPASLLLPIWVCACWDTYLPSPPWWDCASQGHRNWPTRRCGSNECQSYWGSLALEVYMETVYLQGTLWQSTPNMSENSVSGIVKLLGKLTLGTKNQLFRQTSLVLSLPFVELMTSCKSLPISQFHISVRMSLNLKEPFQL